LRGKLGALPPGPAALLPRTRPSSNGINGLYGHGFYFGNGYGNGYGTLEIKHCCQEAQGADACKPSSGFVQTTRDVATNARQQGGGTMTSCRLSVVTAAASEILNGVISEKPSRAGAEIARPDNAAPDETDRG